MTPGRETDLYPLEVNPTTHEPFLRLRKHKNVILTPPRLDDVPYLLEHHNDQRVYQWLVGPPFPYLQEHAIEWLTTIKGQTDKSLERFNAGSDSDGLSIGDICPVRSIREIVGEVDNYIGDIGIGRLLDSKLLTGESDKDWEEENGSLPAGDPRIVWTIGDYLAPSHHRQGIMSDAVETLIRDWAIPRMGVRHILVSTMVGNEGSMGVFRKNGFVWRRTAKDHLFARGQLRSIEVFEWNYI